MRAPLPRPLVTPVTRGGVFLAGGPACSLLGWSHLQAVVDAARGQNHYHFGQAVAANGAWLAVGATDANMAKGVWTPLMSYFCRPDPLCPVTPPVGDEWLV